MPLFKRAKPTPMHKYSDPTLVAATHDDGAVSVLLTADEALVLFELLHRWEDADAVSGPLVPGEQTALWALSGRLESQLVEPFDKQYLQLVAKARERLYERGGA
jgi:hypothetical protein